MSQEIAPTLPIATKQIVLPRDIASQASPKTAPAVPSADTAQAKSTAADTVLIDKARANQGDRLRRIEGSMTENTTLATRVRQTDAALDSAHAQVQAMKDNLAKIVKNYPPFPIESKERMEILRSYISLRKEIDRLSIPTPPERAAELKSPIWKEQGLTQMLPGDLTVNAPDAQVRGAYSLLGIAAEAISKGKQELRQALMPKG